MPERRIPWRNAADRYDGRFRVKQGLQATDYSLRAVVDGVDVRALGRSEPFSLSSGRCEIRARIPDPSGARLVVQRNAGTVPLLRRFFMRDVKIGDGIFDHAWIVNARREAHAQLVLGSDERLRLEAVPALESKNFTMYSPAHLGLYYAFEIRGRAVHAYSTGFETSEARLVAAIDAVVALARRKHTAVAEWQRLASALDGRLEHSEWWRLDGSTRILFPWQGQRVTSGPRLARTGWRRERLHTRVACECAGERRLPVFSSEGREALGLLEEQGAQLVKAYEAAGACQLVCTGRELYVELDGNVIDAQRLGAAASVVVALSQDAQSGAGPYR